MTQDLPLIPPGEILLEEFMKPMGISQNRLARDLDVPVGRVNEVVKGKRAITADTAFRLALYFGATARFWLNLQGEYDLKRIHREKGDAIQKRVRKLEVA